MQWNSSNSYMLNQKLRCTNLEPNHNQHQHHHVIAEGNLVIHPISVTSKMLLVMGATKRGISDQFAARVQALSRVVAHVTLAKADPKAEKRNQDQ